MKNASLISSVISSSVANLKMSNLKANVTVTLQNIKPNQVWLTFWQTCDHFLILTKSGKMRNSKNLYGVGRQRNSIHNVLPTTESLHKHDS